MNQTFSRFNLRSYSPAGWSPLLELSGGSMTEKSSLRLALSEDSYATTVGGVETRIARRVLHLVWTEDDGAGAVARSIPRFSSSTVATSAGIRWSPSTAWRTPRHLRRYRSAPSCAALRRSLATPSGRVVISFVHSQTGRLVALDLQQLPGELGQLAEMARGHIVELAARSTGRRTFESLQGMFKPLQERVSKAEELAQKAAESTRAWRERAMQLEQGMSVPSPTPQQPTPQAPRQDVADDTKGQLDEALSNVNGELFESLAREHGLPLAGRYLAAQVLATVHDKMLPALRKEIMDQIQPELEPLKQDRGFQQATQHVAGLIETVGEYKNTDGTDAFPELRDPQQVYEIGDLWRSMDLPAEIALTPKGLLQAVALYRMYKSTGGGQTTTSTPQVEVSRPTTTAPSPVIQALEAGQAIAPGRVRGDSDGQRFARELESAPLVDPVLGFSIRRRR